MNAKYVYGAYRDPKKWIYWGTITKAIADAYDHGYSFVLFNGCVYFVASREDGYITPIKEEDIFCNLV